MFDAQDDCRTNPSAAPTFVDVIEQRLNRRQFLQGSAFALFAATIPSFSSKSAAPANTVQQGQALGFTEISSAISTQSRVAAGYKEQVLLRWGDALFPDAPPFDLQAQTAQSQQRQFGYNNDYIAYMPLEGSTRGLLCVNHEYTCPHLMFKGVTRKNAQAKMTPALTHIEMAAVGLSVVEIALMDDVWQVVKNSRYNRRFDALETIYAVSGAAAGHKRLQTPSDPSGKRIVGMIGNCAGGVTPWGTVLTCEENFSYYFTGANPLEQENNERYGVLQDEERYTWWATADARFDLAKEPNAPNRYGWVVEIDPYNPQSVPVKRTSLGRFKHECATCIVSSDGRVVVYSGDDQAFEFIYKYVSNGRFDPKNPKANTALLDDGILYAAQFKDDGTVTWLPLVYGKNGLTPENRFYSQADVCIEARRAASLLGATPMDRPEDIAISPVTGKVYVALTKNPKRLTVTNAANPRRLNLHGHIIEIIPNAGDHASIRDRWDIFLSAGNPNNTLEGARYHSDVSQQGWFSCPDNVSFDSLGRLWIGTDGAEKASSMSESIYACETEGGKRALTKRFYAAPIGAETTGPCFTPDGKTLFVSVQHPAEKSKSLEDVQTRWPDFDPKLTPRPAVVALRKKDGGVIGG